MDCVRNHATGLAKALRCYSNSTSLEAGFLATSCRQRCSLARCAFEPLVHAIQRRRPPLDGLAGHGGSDGDETEGVRLAKNVAISGVLHLFRPEKDVLSGPATQGPESARGSARQQQAATDDLS